MPLNIGPYICLMQSFMECAKRSLQVLGFNLHRCIVFHEKEWFACYTYALLFIPEPIPDGDLPQISTRVVFKNVVIQVNKLPQDLRFLVEVHRFVTLALLLFCLSYCLLFILYLLFYLVIFTKYFQINHLCYLHEQNVNKDSSPFLR